MNRGASSFPMLILASTSLVWCYMTSQGPLTVMLPIYNGLKRQLADFITAHRIDLFDVESIKVYYDCGQAPVTNLLHKTFEEELGKHVEFAQGVHPENYRLFQLADLVCSLHLIERRLAEGDPMTTSEMRLFGGPRDFKRNILKKIKAKEIK